MLCSSGFLVLLQALVTNIFHLSTKFAELKAAGIDDVIAVSVSDPQVMKAFGETWNNQDVITLIADWDCSFSKMIGKVADRSSIGFGWRPLRFLMYLRDGRVAREAIDTKKGHFEKTSAEAALRMINESKL
eukprot:1034293_1